MGGGLGNMPRYRIKNKTEVQNFYTSVPLILTLILTNQHYWKWNFPLTRSLRLSISWLVGWCVGLSVLISQKGGKFHFHAYIGGYFFCHSHVPCSIFVIYLMVITSVNRLLPLGIVFYRFCVTISWDRFVK